MSAPPLTLVEPASDGIAFTVYGVPAPAGSKRGFYNQKTRRVIVTDDSARSRPWKALVTDAAVAATAGRPLLTGPLALTLIFHVPRPKSHYGTGSNARRVRGSAPTWPIVKPDLLKLARAVEDALSQVIYRDDAQIVQETLAKRYGEPARVEITVSPLGQEGATAWR